MLENDGENNNEDLVAVNCDMLLINLAHHCCTNMMDEDMSNMEEEGELEMQEDQFENNFENSVISETKNYKKN